jgi:hypothetical protein
MHAVVTTWRLRLAARSPDRDAFIRALVARGITAARAQGVVDVVMIVVEPDRLMAVSLFETLAEALATRPVALAFVLDQYTETLELISRVTGQAYELADVADLDISVVRQNRGPTSGETHAQLTTWRLGPEMRSSDQLVEFLRMTVSSALPAMLEQGLTDVIGVRTADDTLLVIQLAQQPEALVAQPRTADLPDRLGRIAGKGDLVESVTGRAFDIPTLLGAE